MGNINDFILRSQNDTPNAANTGTRKKNSAIAAKKKRKPEAKQPSGVKTPTPKKLNDDNA